MGLFLYSVLLLMMISSYVLSLRLPYWFICEYRRRSHFRRYVKLRRGRMYFLSFIFYSFWLYSTLARYVFRRRLLRYRYVYYAANYIPTEEDRCVQFYFLGGLGGVGYDLSGSLSGVLLGFSSFYWVYAGFW